MHQSFAGIVTRTSSTYNIIYYVCQLVYMRKQPAATASSFLSQYTGFTLSEVVTAQVLNTQEFTGSSKLYVFTMCHTEDVFHGPCRHWGRERFIGGPCCRSRIVDGRHTGCGYIEKIGAVNSNELCSDCKFRLTRGRGWKPFAHVSDDGWAKVEEKLRQRSAGSDDFLYLQNGSSQTPIQKRDYSSLAQS
jgi:hypothetical protein